VTFGVSCLRKPCRASKHNFVPHRPHCGWSFLSWAARSASLCLSSTCNHDRPSFFVMLKGKKDHCGCTAELASDYTCNSSRKQDTSDFLLRQWEKRERQTAMREVKDLLLLLLLSSGCRGQVSVTPRRILRCRVVPPLFTRKERACGSTTKLFHPTKILLIPPE